MWCVVVLALLGNADEATRVRDALVREQRGDDPAALAALDQQIREDPGGALARIEAARIRMKRGEDLDRAQTDLDAARSLAPDNPRVHYLFGEVMQERGNLAEAVRALELAIAMRDDYPDARERLAALYFAQGDWAQAETQYRAVTRHRPERTADRMQLSAALEKQGRQTEAESELKHLLAEQPTSVLVARRLAEFYDRTDQPKLAAKIRAKLDPAEKRKLRDLKRSSR